MKEIRCFRALLLAAVCAVVAAAPASSATTLTAKNGRTVYVLDRDNGGVPTCYDACAKQWPPYLANEGEQMGEPWGTVKRRDGSRQRTYQNKPLYFYADDKKAGDANGDRVGRIWHVIKQ